MAKASLLLLPFAAVYNGITKIRNLAFNQGLLPVYEPKVPCIAVGNLSMGGTGKTPMIEFLIESFADRKIGVVSRGYGRKTKGLLLVDQNGSPQDYGDESLQIAQKYPIKVWVSEQRALGVQAAEAAGCELILLDDAFQHRYVKAHRYLLLSTFKRPFFNDFVVPAGYLRESRKGAKRAQHIIISKCPANLNPGLQDMYRKACRKYSAAPIHFSQLEYGSIVSQFGNHLEAKQDLALITAIANTQTLEEMLSTKGALKKHWQYRDHHPFTKQELESHLAKAKKEKYSLVCTDKDWVKIKPLLAEIDPEYPVYRVPVKPKFSEQDREVLLTDLNSLFSTV